MASASVPIAVRAFMLFLVFLPPCLGQCDQRSSGGVMKCCPGKDTKCFVKKNLTNAVGDDRGVCYCDEFCKFTKDCCDDFLAIEKQCLGHVDCQVTEWSDYSQCSTECGLGTMTRKRSVLQLPKNGGLPCPPLIQVKGCNLDNWFCTTQSYETGFILPISFRRPAKGTWHYELIGPAPVESNSIESDDATYCINYKLVNKRDQCAGSWADHLDESKPVCVECQFQARREGRCRGEGVVGMTSRWKALKVHRCHGIWIRFGPVIANCSCQSEEFSNFVFV